MFYVDIITVYVLHGRFQDVNVDHILCHINVMLINQLLEIFLLR